MNFEQWFRKDRIVGLCSLTTRNDYQIGWDACKKEVLKLLNHNQLDINNSDLKFLKEEIEKL
jgi:hypothetical protein